MLKAMVVKHFIFSKLHDLDQKHHCCLWILSLSVDSVFVFLVSLNEPYLAVDLSKLLPLLNSKLTFSFIGVKLGTFAGLLCFGRPLCIKNGCFFFSSCCLWTSFVDILVFLISDGAWSCSSLL